MFWFGHRRRLLGGLGDDNVFGTEGTQFSYDVLLDMSICRWFLCFVITDGAVALLNIFTRRFYGLELKPFTFGAKPVGRFGVELISPLSLLIGITLSDELGVLLSMLLLLLRTPLES